MFIPTIAFVVINERCIRGVAYNANQKIAQECQGGTRRIMHVGIHTINYHFQQKIAFVPNLTVMFRFYPTIGFYEHVVLKYGEMLHRLRGMAALGLNSKHHPP